MFLYFVRVRSYVMPDLLGQSAAFIYGRKYEERELTDPSN